MVFVRSRKGMALLEQIQDKMECLKVDVEDAYRENGNLVNSSQVHERREDFLAQVTPDNFEELVRKYFPKDSEKSLGLLWRIKRKLDRLF